MDRIFPPTPEEGGGLTYGMAGMSLSNFKFDPRKPEIKPNFWVQKSGNWVENWKNFSRSFWNGEYSENAQKNPEIFATRRRIIK